MRLKPLARTILAFTIIAALPACAPGLFQNYFSSNGLQVTPASTTVGIGQSLTFQVTGGTPPYNYQVSGVGSIDGSGNYQSGSYTGQSQIQVTDSNYTTGTAMVSVVQSDSLPNSYSPQSYRMSRAAPQPSGWHATTPTQLKQAPPVRGQVLAVQDQNLDSQGDTIRSKFIKTNLKHSIVRLDTLIERKRIVATRAVIEDQFVVTLGEGHTESELSSAVAKAGAYISKQLKEGTTYLVSMNPALHASAVNETFLADRATLKQLLQSLGNVTPNFVSSRAPAADQN